jgi:hypothetical protein
MTGWWVLSFEPEYLHHLADRGAVRHRCPGPDGLGSRINPIRERSA